MCQYGSYSIELNCFQSVETVTACHNASDHSNQNDDLLAKLISRELLDDPLQGPNLYLRHYLHTSLRKNKSMFGGDGYALFLREEFKSRDTFRQAIVIVTLSTAISLVDLLSSLPPSSRTQHWLAVQNPFHWTVVLFPSDHKTHEDIKGPMDWLVPCF